MVVNMNQTTELMCKAIEDYAMLLAENRRSLAELRYESERALDMLNRGSTRFPNMGPTADRVYVRKVRMESAVMIMEGLTSTEIASAIIMRIAKSAFPTIAADEIINGLKEKKNND